MRTAAIEFVWLVPVLIATHISVTRADEGRPPHHGPPPAAFDVCANAKPGDACSVQLHDRSMSGTCAAFGDQGLVCRPDAPPEAFAACRDAAAGDACSVKLHDHEHEGTCQPAGNQGLVCRPDGPPPPHAR